jgi:hypothetical protein
MLLLLIQKIFRRKDGELSVFGRLAAGACAGMTSTLVIYFICLLANAPVFLFLLDMGILNIVGFFFGL